MFQRALAAAGVKNRSLHSTRHTFISIARSNGARRYVLERVTHSASGETIDGYTMRERGETIPDPAGELVRRIAVGA